MVDVFAVLSQHAEARLVTEQDDPWRYTGIFRCMCGVEFSSEGIPVDPYPSVTRYVLRRHQAEVLQELIMSKGEVLRREAEWLERAVSAAEQHPIPYHHEYLKGAKAGAGWVRFHSENPENYHHLHTSKEREHEDGTSQPERDGL
jgi:hypothetical protein